MRQIIFFLLLLLGSSQAEAQPTTLRQEMQHLQALHGLHFVYASDLNLDRPYTGPALEGLEVKDALNHLFYNQGIRITRRRNNIILNATGATLSRSQNDPIPVTSTDSNATYPLSEIIIKGKNDRVEATHHRMGESMVRGEHIGLGFSTLSTPDLLKTLQHTSGVSAGYELGTDFYVHGGGGDENLVLVDGTPLYSTTHVLGIFSSFNTDMIDSVNFYKSNFPSRYSGRLSSVTDVSIRDGNMQHFKGLFSLGMFEGRLQAEGPIVKERTSYNVGIRRSWSDLYFRPILFLADKFSDDDDTPTVGFDYHDLNAKLTHKLSDTDKLWLSLYSGRDFVDVETKDRYTWNADNCEEDKTRLQWRKWNGTVGWQHQFSPTLSSRMALIGTFNHSLMAIENKSYKLDYEDHITQWNLSNRKKNVTRMFDLGARADFQWQAAHRHLVEFGGQLMYHGFRPQSSELTFYYGHDEGMDTTSTMGSYRTHSQELTAYIEDAITLSPRLTANIGTSLTLLNVKGRLYPLLDPRLSLDYRWSRLWMASLSCTHMSQHVHRLSPSLLSLPTDFWVPSTAKVRPSGSWQFTAGIHGIAPSNVLRFSLEGFYKQSRNLLTYRNWSGIQPVASRWESDVTSGSGRSWGMEADVILDLLDGWGQRPPRHGVLPVNYLQFSYTLSWTQRQFRDIYDGWYPDQFDNRHKLDILAHIKLGRKAVLTAAWSYHTGNRITLPEQIGFMPITPGHDWRVEDGFIYDKPNNFRLPAYHRLDIGVDFHHITKRGFERIWNVSLYNAYCHMNTLFVEMRNNSWSSTANSPGGNTSSTPSASQQAPSLTARGFGYIPIIPSFSYTLKF